MGLPAKAAGQPLAGQTADQRQLSVMIDLFAILATADFLIMLA
jgi:hypothetical protein